MNRTMKYLRIAIIASVLLILMACGGEYFEEEMMEDNYTTSYSSTILNGIKVETWMYQLQNLYETDAVDALAATQYDMLVVEPGYNFAEYPYQVEYLVDALKKKPDGDERILLAYIDIGQAEDYRDYWQEDWIAPTKHRSGEPEFLITIDPDGWSGNYPVAYWDEEWQTIWLGENGIIVQLAEFGFDGVYLDWVEAYDDPKIRETAIEEGLNPEMEMIYFIEKIGSVGKEVSTDFLVIPQNAPYLLDEDSEYYVSIIDAIATEDTWYYGEGDAEWDDRKAGDLSGGVRHSEGYSTEDRIFQNQKYLDMGIPVFTIDYCIDEDNAENVYTESRKYGFIPLVSRVSLSEITETPPF